MTTLSKSFNINAENYLFFPRTVAKYWIEKLGVPGFGCGHCKACALRTSAVVEVLAELNLDCSGHGCLGSAATNQDRCGVSRQQRLEIGLIRAVSASDSGAVSSSGRNDGTVFTFMFATVVTSSVTSMSSGTSKGYGQEENE